MIPVRMMTAISTNPSTRLGKLPVGWTMYVTIHKMAPTHNMIANQFASSFKNNTQAGVFFFSGNLLSPSSKFLAKAA